MDFNLLYKGINAYQFYWINCTYVLHWFVNYLKKKRLQIQKDTAAYLDRP